MENDREDSLENAAHDRAERIRARAYQLWLDEGMPEGCDLKHWCQAELECEDKHEDVPVTRKKTVRASS